MSGSGNDLAIREGAVMQAPAAALAIQAGQTAFDQMQRAALAQLGLEDAPDGDLSVFLHVAQRTGLDPFSRQIYMIPRNEKVPGTKDQWRKKYTIQTGIDGLRVMRARAERKAGVRGILSPPVFYDVNGNGSKVWVKPGPPVACEITYTVRDANGETPYTSILRFTEYAQYKDGNLTAQWAVKHAHLLEKCTEADVYRKAYPQDFSGIVLDDAMPPARSGDWDNMSDEELDARAAAVGYRPRVTAAQAKARAPQQVTATVETVTPDPSPAAPESPRSAPSVTPADTAAAGEADNGPAPDDPAYRRAMNAAQAQLKRFITGDTEEELSESKRILAARILRVEVIASMSDLNVAELRTISNTCGSATGPDSAAQLEALLTKGVAPGAE